MQKWSTFTGEYVRERVYQIVKPVPVRRATKAKVHLAQILYTFVNTHAYTIYV